MTLFASPEVPLDVPEYVLFVRNKIYLLTHNGITLTDYM